MAPKATILHLALLTISCATAQVTFSRGDQNAYLALRQSSFKLPLLSTNNATHHPNNDPNPCTIYLAPSSIPSAGLGLYTSIALPSKTIIGSPQLGLLLQDPDFHTNHISNSFSLLSNYVWSASPLSFGEYEVSHGEAVCTGVGMMANAHYGLTNVHHYSEWRNSGDKDGTDAWALEGVRHDLKSDVGKGGYSWHSVRYESLGLEAGEEMFLSYGPQWFENAQKEFGGAIPGKEHFEEADQMLQQFHKTNNDSTQYQSLLQEIARNNPRLRAAFPDTWDDVPAAVKMGTARFSAKDSIRSPSWLEENGVCLDTIAGGTSTLPQAGRGAFATRSIPQEGVISTTPLVTIDRNHLKLFKESIASNGKVRRRFAGYQLLLNYCFGHSESSLVFFPTSPTVSLINHAEKEKANAIVRWSTRSYHKSDWLHLSLDEMKKRGTTGLLFDIVATKDIARGDEILLYYGDAWEEKWTQHTERWGSSSKNFTDRLGLPSILDYNSNRTSEMIRTVEELKDDPLPDHIMTRCGFALPGEMKKELANSGKVKDLSVTDVKYEPCEILDVEPLDGTNRYLYRAKVEHTSPSGDVTYYSVKYDSGQDFLRYVDKPYTKDYYGKGAFRHSIGLSDEMMPSQWLDLRKDDDR